MNVKGIFTNANNNLKDRRISVSLKCLIKYSCKIKTDDVEYSQNQVKAVQ